MNKLTERKLTENIWITANQTEGECQCEITAKT